MGIVTPVGLTSGVKALDVEWFAADIAALVLALYASKVRVHLAVSDGSQDLQYTLDGGTTWTILFEAADVVNEKGLIREIPIRNGDTFNIRTKVVAGTTVRYCRVDEITSEG